MKNLNIKNSLWVLLAISGAIWFFAGKYQGLNFSEIVDYFKVLPAVVAADAAIVGIFIKWAWKIRIFKGWLVKTPNINGTWQGHIKSTWIDPEIGQPLKPIPAILTIRQSFLNISCVMRTAEMTSHSYSSEIKFQSDDQIKQLTYSYTSRPKATITGRSPLHEGSVILEIIGDPPKKLKGEYWTARKTTGEIEMTFKDKKLTEEYLDDHGKHPIMQK